MQWQNLSLTLITRVLADEPHTALEDARDYEAAILTNILEYAPEINFWS